jgi:hypothetical protein
MEPEFAEFPTHGRIHCRERLGGMLRFYHRESSMKTRSSELLDSTGSKSLYEQIFPIHRDQTTNGQASRLRPRPNVSRFHFHFSSR